TMQMAVQLGDTEADAAAKLLTLRAVAQAQARLGDFQRALQTAKAIQNSPAGTPSQMATFGSTLGAIAMAQAQAGDMESARQTFQQAREATAGVLDGSRDNVLAEIAADQAEAGDCDEALARAGELSSPLSKARVLLGVSQGVTRRERAAAAAPQTP